MLTTEKFDKAYALLTERDADGNLLPLTAVAARIDVSLGTLHRIRVGKMKRPDPKRIAQVAERNRSRYKLGRFRKTVPYQCSHCHSRVMLTPCPVCESRAVRARLGTNGVAK